MINEFYHHLNISVPPFLVPFVKEPFDIHSHVRECLRRKGGTNHVGDFCLFFLPCILVEQDQGTSVQKTVWVW